jgi:hypothetical protein
VVGCPRGAAAAGVAAVEEDGPDGALHAEAAREGAAAERALAARQLVAAGRADEQVAAGGTLGFRPSHPVKCKRILLI